MAFKKTFAFILCVFMLVSSVSGIMLSVSAQQTTGVINGTNVRMRSTPSTSSAQVYKFTNANQTVNILETVSGQEAEQGHGTTWYKVSTLDGAYTGYVYGYYVTVNTTPAPEPNPDPTPTPTPTPNPDFETQLAAFPESYRASLTALHEKHPNWIFVAEKLPMSFDNAVMYQYTNVRKMVELSQGIAWRSLQKDQYNWESDTWKILDGDRWVAASKEVIGYYMDPRNFLDENYVYMFMVQSYDKQYQTEEGLTNIINGTFLANNYTPNADDPVDALYGGSYAKVIMAAAESSKISPYVIAAKIITEQGVSGSSHLISGNYNETYASYYNFFNWGAYGTGGATVVEAGLQRAKEKGWDSRADSIIGGAKELADGYIDQSQDTYYYMDFNVRNPDKYWHQYAASAYDAYVKASNLSRAYKNSFDNAPLVFNIPVYSSIPAAAATKAEKGDNRYNNYYLSDMSVDGLSPKFNMYASTYNLSISGDTTVYVKLPKNARIISNMANVISRGDNSFNIVVESESGFTNFYTLNVTSTQNATLTLVVGDPPSEETPPTGGENPPTGEDNPPSGGENPPSGEVTPPAEDPPAIKKGDTNGDDVINIVDLANVQKHLLNIITLTDGNLDAADTNNDGTINIVDLANIQKHLLGIINIT